MTLKELIQNYRAENGLSQREFASKCGLSNAAISIIEKDKINPKTGKRTVTSIETCIKIADGMGITLEELFLKLDNVPIRIDTSKRYSHISPSVAEKLEEGGRAVLSEPSQPGILFQAIDNDEQDILRLFRSLTDEGKQYLLQQAKIAQQIYGK